MFSKWSVGLLVFILAACAPVTPQPTPLPEPVAWQIQITPTLEWMGPLMNVCAPVGAQYSILVDQVPFSSIKPSDSDITLTWSAPQELPPHTFELGRDVLVVIAHPDNPLQSLSESDWQAVYQGRINEWKTINPDLEALGKIQFVTYDSENDVSMSMSVITGGLPSLQTTAFIAPHPLAAREWIAGHPPAIGYLPGRWLNQSVRQVSLDLNQPEKTEQPILALMNQPPNPEQQQWLQCLSLAIKTQR